MATTFGCTTNAAPSKASTYIDPDVCIDCGACIPACPVHAIYETVDMPDDQRRWVAINAERSHALPVVYAKQEPLAHRRRTSRRAWLLSGETATSVAVCHFAAKGQATVGVFGRGRP
jgi:ferredoxin